MGRGRKKKRRRRVYPPSQHTLNVIVRDELYHKQNGKCCYCKRDMIKTGGGNAGATCTLEHKDDRRNVRDNHVASCQRCNQLKAQWTHKQFKALLKGRTNLPEIHTDEWKVLFHEFRSKYMLSYLGSLPRPTIVNPTVYAHLERYYEIYMDHDMPDWILESEPL